MSHWCSLGFPSLNFSSVCEGSRSNLGTGHKVYERFPARTVSGRLLDPKCPRLHFGQIVRSLFAMLPVCGCGMPRKRHESFHPCAESAHAASCVCAHEGGMRESCLLCEPACRISTNSGGLYWQTEQAFSPSSCEVSASKGLTAVPHCPADGSFESRLGHPILKCAEVRKAWLYQSFES